jgi:hypothetical protein
MGPIDMHSRALALRLPSWAPRAALFVSLAIAWVNFLFTAKWAALPGALHGPRKPWYLAALMASTLFAVVYRRDVGRPVVVNRAAAWLLVACGAVWIVAVLLLRLPPSLWLEIPFKDDWAPRFQSTVDSVRLLRRGAAVGWNWWFLGGYPTSTDLGQSFGVAAFLPMLLFGERPGYHVLHAVLFLIVPVYVWWDVSRDDRQTALVAAGFACFLAAGLQGSLGASGDTNSLVGLCSAGLALVGSRAAQLGRRWGGPLLMIGLALTIYSHVAFFLYTFIYLVVEAVYFRDRSAWLRIATASAAAIAAGLPLHWESVRYGSYVSFNNFTYDPHAPVDWVDVARRVYYNVEILAFPHRWFNDYRSLANVWLAALVVVALWPQRSRAGFYAWAALATQLLLRVNTPEAGAVFDRIQHMLPLLLAPALAGFVTRCAGARPLACALLALIGLYPQTWAERIPHVPDLRAFDRPLVDRIATLDGNLVLVELSPHRDMDRDPKRRTPPTPFDVHFEALLPQIAGQRFYSQMWDGYVWSVFRGQIVAAGTFEAHPIAETPPPAFAAEMRKWGVRHLMVWSDATRDYLARSGIFVERWRHGRWSHFELPDADVRSVVTPHGSGELRNLDFLGADVVLDRVSAGDTIVVRTNYYPAWRAAVPLFSHAGQLAFNAPTSGSYVVRLEYPRYRVLTALALAALVIAGVLLTNLRTAPHT